MAERRTAPTVERLYSTRELADAWGMSDDAIRTRIRSGELEHVRIGRSIRITESAAAAYLERQREDLR